MRRSRSGEDSVFPLPMTALRSTPTTFSPTTMGMPTRAHPAAKESQYLAAMNVDPRAPVIRGIPTLVLVSAPKEDSTLTFVNRQLSGSLDPPGLTPFAP